MQHHYRTGFICDGEVSGSEEFSGVTVLRWEMEVAPSRRGDDRRGIMLAPVQSRVRGKGHAGIIYQGCPICSSYRPNLPVPGGIWMLATLGLLGGAGCRH